MAVLNFDFVLASVFLAISNAAPTRDFVSVLEMPAECQGSGFCSVKPKGYEYFEEKMKNILPTVLTVEYSDRIEDNPLQPPKLSPKEDWDNCPSWTKSELMYTYRHSANNTQQMDLIVQTDVFKQVIETVSCAREYIPKDSVGVDECFRGLNLNLLKSGFDIESTCVTSYAKRSLYVFNYERNVIIQKPYYVPVCCSCSTKARDTIDNSNDLR